jgi:excisionase family DNA binding protein
LNTEQSTLRRCSSRGSLPKKALDKEVTSDVMTLIEAAAFLRCHKKTLCRQALPRKIPHKRLGSAWRFYRPKLVAWMQEND